jgi:ATP-dependent RNA helicase DeaD
MSGLVELKLQPAVAAALESCGYTAADAAIREQVPAAIRGTNLVLAAPPSARHAVPVLAGLVSALAAADAQALLLAPSHALDEWAASLLPLAEQAGLQALVAVQPARATRRLRDGQLRLLLTSPETALALLERSALKADQLQHVVLAWPELFDSGEALTALMQDLPTEAQRILILAAPKPGHPLVERYARRALQAGPLATAEHLTTGLPDVRMALVPWSRRGLALSRLLEAEDPASLAVWCLDGESAREAKAALPVGDASVRVLHGEIPSAELIVAWDLPAPTDLVRLRAAGDVVLLTPPHALRYVTEITSRQKLVRLPGAADEAHDEAGRRRSVIQAEVVRGELDGELLALSPLFERDDPARVAAALYRLWLAKPAGTLAPTGTAKPAAEVARVWVGIGRKDGAGAADLVGILTREIGIDASKIGRIEIRELFSLVEVPAAEAEAIAQGLSGKTIRRRQVVAKVDRGRPSDGSRGPSGPSPRGRPARPRP